MSNTLPAIPPQAESWEERSLANIRRFGLITRYEDGKRTEEQTAEMLESLSKASSLLLEKLGVASAPLLVVPDLSLKLPVHTQYGIANRYSPRTAVDKNIFQEGPRFNDKTSRYRWNVLSSFGALDDESFGVSFQLESHRARVVALAETQNTALQTGTINLAGVLMLAGMQRAAGLKPFTQRIEFPQYPAVDVDGVQRVPTLIPVPSHLKTSQHFTEPQCQEFAIYGSYPDKTRSVEPSEAAIIPVFG